MHHRRTYPAKREDLYPVIPIAETININKPVNSWAAVAKKHGLTYLQLHEANPWIRSAAMANKNMKSYKVKIPSVQSLKYDPKKTIAHDIRWITE